MLVVQCLIRSLVLTGVAVGLRSASIAPLTSGVCETPAATSSLFILLTISAVVIDNDVCATDTTTALPSVGSLPAVNIKLCPLVE